MIRVKNDSYNKKMQNMYIGWFICHLNNFYVYQYIPWIAYKLEQKMESCLLCGISSNKKNKAMTR